MLSWLEQHGNTNTIYKPCKVVSMLKRGVAFVARCCFHKHDESRNPPLIACLSLKNKKNLCKCTEDFKINSNKQNYYYTNININLSSSVRFSCLIFDKIFHFLLMWKVKLHLFKWVLSVWFLVTCFVIFL